MRRDDYTSIGGGEGRFQATHWSAIGEVRKGQEGCAQTLIGELLTTYWKPLYCYLRHRGYDNEEAKDLTHTLVSLALDDTVKLWDASPLESH